MSPEKHAEHQPLNLHAATRASEAAGFTRPIQLQSHQMAHLARSLRGIDAVTSVLTAETGDDCSDTAMILGDYLRMGLLEAIAVMTTNAHQMLDELNDAAKLAAKPTHSAAGHLR